MKNYVYEFMNVKTVADVTIPVTQEVRSSETNIKVQTTLTVAESRKIKDNVKK